MNGKDDSGEITVDPDLLRLLACPICPERPSIELVGHYLVCSQCHNAFPVRDGIPQLTPEDAVPVSQVKDQLDD